MARRDLMAITTRAWRPGDDVPLATFAVPVRPTLWWWAHPTLVAETDAGRIVGYASFTLSLPPTTELAELQPREIGWGQGMAVHPAYQGRGIGRQLIEARAAMLRALGCRFFIGHAAPGQRAMETLFASQGLTPVVTIAQDDGTDLHYYMGAL